MSLSTSNNLMLSVNFTAAHSLTTALRGCLSNYYYILRESQTTQNVLWSRAYVCLYVCVCVCRGLRAPPAGDRPPTGALSTLLRQSGLRASTGGVLATKSERKMLASTCLYSIYAWFCILRQQLHAAVQSRLQNGSKSRNAGIYSHYGSIYHLCVQHAIAEAEYSSDRTASRYC